MPAKRRPVSWERSRHERHRSVAPLRSSLTRIPHATLHMQAAKVTPGGSWCGQCDGCCLLQSPGSSGKPAVAAHCISLELSLGRSSCPCLPLPLPCAAQAAFTATASSAALAAAATVRSVALEGSACKCSKAESLVPRTLPCHPHVPSFASSAALRLRRRRLHLPPHLLRPPCRPRRRPRRPRKLVLLPAPLMSPARPSYECTGLLTCVHALFLAGRHHRLCLLVRPQPPFPRHKKIRSPVSFLHHLATSCEWCACTRLAPAAPTTALGMHVCCCGCIPSPVLNSALLALHQCRYVTATCRVAGRWALRLPHGRCCVPSGRCCMADCRRAGDDNVVTPPGRQGACQPASAAFSAAPACLTGTRRRAPTTGRHRCRSAATRPAAATAGQPRTTRAGPSWSPCLWCMMAWRTQVQLRLRVLVQHNGIRGMWRRAHTQLLHPLKSRALWPLLSRPSPFLQPHTTSRLRMRGSRRRTSRTDVRTAA